jgi:gamma-glutamylcyclotransferase (GGCT)/AIG2-like uncharacterized protein YtfP
MAKTTSAKQIVKKTLLSHPLPKSKNGTEPVFVYGTLRSENTRKQAIGIRIPVYKAEAEGEVKQEGEYSTISFLRGGHVEGDVMNLTHSQLKKVDKWEEEYTRHPVRLKDGTVAWAYSRKPWFNTKGKPTKEHPSYQ